MKRVFFHVQHLLGIGHLKRAATICRALAQAGFDVTLASGGAALSDVGVKLVQLPPMSALDATFKVLVDEHGNPVGEDGKRVRAARLMQAWREARADVLVVELFPFGRRQLRFELEPLLAAAGEALVVCSARDLLQRRPAREAEALELFERDFDRLLVHGDPRVATFERSFSLAPKLGDRLAYTGYVVEPPPEADSDAGKGEVIVSAGGGAVGQRLIETAIAARPLTRLRERTWRVITGMNAGYPLPQADGIVVERFREDFTTLLRNCELSISQAGYNTLMETLQARARAVVVPFSQGSETEQGWRAKLFADKKLVEMVEEGDLSPATLAAAVDRAAAWPRPARVELDLNGARRSAELIARWTA